MENWGAITFDSQCFNSERWNDWNCLTRNYRTIAHEVSHMWFGNLVTMDWWERIWLNEGFARYMEHKALGILRPELETDLLFITDIAQDALKIDSDDTHPVEFECLDSE